MSNWISEQSEHGVHAFTGGDGSRATLVLIPGWPQTADAYSEVFPFLARSHRTFCVDPPGLGGFGAI